jgi:hypothetical protein
VPGILTEIFFPADENKDTTRHAKAICAQCVVRQDCLEFALTDPVLPGVYGGTTKRERTTINNRRAAERQNSLMDDDSASFPLINPQP